MFIHEYEAKAVPDDPAKVPQIWRTALHNQYDEFTQTQQSASAAFCTRKGSARRLRLGATIIVAGKSAEQ